MTQQEDTNLRHLLTIFGAEHLGEGDLVAGANLVAAKACSIANVARPGSGLQAADGTTLEVGTSLLISGPHSAALAGERILKELVRRQRNLKAHIRLKVRGIEGESLKPGFKASDHMEPDPRNSHDQVLDPAFHELGPWGTDLQALLGSAVEEPPHAAFGSLCQHHQVFMTGSKPAEVAAQLELCHEGRPFIHVGVDGPKDFTRFGQQCLAVMDGRLAVGEKLENICGNVVVTDSSQALGEVVRTGGMAAQWASRMLWLVDGGTGPEAPAPDGHKAPVALEHMEQRYNHAMTTAWAQRLNHQDIGPVMLKCEFSAPQARWAAFLKKREPECPGITGTARSLFATLLFGLQKIARAGQVQKGFKWHIGHIEALAKFLVLRMVNARAAMLHSAENARNLRLQATILRKLGDGPLDVRGLCRKTHSLRSVPCQEVLHQLEDAGQVVRIDKEWMLPEFAQALTLEV
jgi:hypothetical protein